MQKSFYKLIDNIYLYGSDISKAVSLTGKTGREALKILEAYDLSEPAVVYLQKIGLDKNTIADKIAVTLASSSLELANGAVITKTNEVNAKDRRLDKIFASRMTGFPVMALMLAVIFWITITGANLPSQLISDLLFGFEDSLYDILIMAHLPESIVNMLVFGMYKVLAWVISVMLPPMAIFFPLFTILEDSGYLPRVAFNLDKCFKKCRACGKQALTMCMGFGCNAAGVTGCRIIDSERERLVAIITNNFVPCNGRFPMLISIITMFFTGYTIGIGQSVLSALILCIIIMLGIAMTFFVSSILTKTVLKGLPSSFILEMPPYRRPKIGDVVVRSIFDRTVFVLGRAVSVAAPAGIVIWLMANINIGNVTVLAACSNFLDPLGRLMGLDGVILMAFILGFPANEIVIPVMIMSYMQSGVLSDMSSLTELKNLLTLNGWTWITAVSMLLFSLMHWPCSTTLLTIKKETGSLKWTFIAFLVPTIAGFIICAGFTAVARALAI
ncbi:Fe(2+) transporter FeoB [Clostridiales bacterium]|nr:Fe(2+) transporter FeoB [Clostridiales bacterium]